MYVYPIYDAIKIFIKVFIALYELRKISSINEFLNTKH